MQVLAHSAGILATALAVHLVLWRVRLPLRQTRALARIFAATAALDLAPALVLWAVWRSPLGLSGWQAAHVALVTAAMAMAYLITYSAFEADSPTLVMVRALDKARPAGLDKAAFQAMLSDEVLVLPRIHDLLRDHMAVLGEDGRYVLTAKGRLMSGLIRGWRLVLGVGKGG